MSESYQQGMRAHFAAYKSQTIGVDECGTWRKKEYPHILPAEPEQTRWLNILEPYRDAFRTYAASKHLRLHRDFSHLNSSQAMCFNLFYPFLAEPNGMRVLGKVLGIGRKPLDSTAEFEKVIRGRDEKTNFDFFFQTDKGRILFEVKLTESKFGSVAGKKYKAQFERVYKPRLAGRIAPDYRHLDRFCANYQICRNLWHLDPRGGDQVFFVTPLANKALKPAENIIKQIADVAIRDQVEVRHLETLVDSIRMAVDGRPRMTKHYRLFANKYLPSLAA